MGSNESKQGSAKGKGQILQSSLTEDNNRRPETCTMGSSESIAKKIGGLKRIGHGIKRLIKFQWAKVKRRVLRKKDTNVVATLQLTDGTVEEYEDLGTDSNGTVLTRVRLSINITSPDEMEWVQRGFQTYFTSTRETREELLNQLIQLYQRFGEETEKINTKADKADIAASSISLASGVLGAVGFGLAFATCGTSLILSLCGAVMGSTAAGISLYFNHKRSKGKKEKWKQIKDTVDAFNKENERLLKIVSEAEYFGLVISGCSVVKSPIQGALTAKKLALTDDAAAIGAKASRVSGSLVRGMGTFGKVLFYGGFALSIPVAAYDIYTIATNSHKLRKGKLSDQAQAYVDMARVFEEFRDSGMNFREIKMG